jgi:hypothetical protein
MFLINLLISSLQQIDSTLIDNINSTRLPISRPAEHNFKNTNATRDREKRETDNQPSHIAVLYPVGSNHGDGTQRSSKYKRCQGRIGKEKVRYDYFQKGIAGSNYMKKGDDVNYYKSIYPSLTADENGSSADLRVDNDGVPVRLTPVLQATDNGCEADTPQALAGYVQQASESDDGRGEGTPLQRLLAVVHGLNKQLKSNAREPTSKFWKPLKDTNGYINTKHQNEGSTKPNTQIYSHFLTGSSTDPSHQNGLETSGTVTEYLYPHHDTKPMFQHLDRTGNSPLKDRVYLKPTLSAKDLIKSNYFPSHQHNNGQIVDLGPYDNRYESFYWEPQTETEYQDTPTTPELKYMLPVTVPELSMTGHTSEHTLNKGTGINEDVRHNTVVSDMPLYLSSDDRRLMQDHFLSQNGINNSPYILVPPSNMERYLPGKSSGVLQVHSIPGAKEMLNSEIVSTHQDVPVTSHYSSHQNQIPSGELSFFTEMNEPSKDLQFKNKNEDRISPEKYKVPAITSMPTWAGLTADHSQCTHRVGSTSPSTDDPERYISNNGRDPAFKTIHFPASTYEATERNKGLSPQKSVPTPQSYHEMSAPSNNINIENGAFQSKTEPQLLHKRPTTYSVTEGTNNIKVSVPETHPFDVSTFISQVSDVSKYLPSVYVPSLHKAKTGILWVPEEARSTSGSDDDDDRFTPQTDSPKSQPSFEVGMVSDRTKSEFSRMLKNTIHDSHSVPISSITSLEHGYSMPTQRSSINMETTSKSEDTFRPVNTIVPKYPAEFEENLAGIYSATTNSPLLTTATLRTYHPSLSEAQPQMAGLNEYNSKTNMGEDAIPTRLYSATETVTAWQNDDYVSNSAAELPYEFKKQFLNKTSDRNSGKEMQEKWTMGSEQSTSVKPNQYKMNMAQDAPDSTTDTSGNDANTEDTNEQTNWHAAGLSTGAVRNQIGSVPMNTKHESIVTDEVTQGQDSKYPVTTMTNLLSELQYIPVSDVTDIYMTTNKPDVYTAMALMAAPDVYKNTYPAELALPDKRPSSENEGDYTFLTARESLPETNTNAADTRAKPPETLTSIQEQILQTTKVTPPETDVLETTRKTDFKINQVPETAINYEGKVPAYKAGAELGTPRSTEYEREQQILDKAAEYESEKPITAPQFYENHKEQTNTQEDTENIFETKLNERPDLKAIHVPETVADYRVNLPTEKAGNELVTPRDKESEREQLSLGSGADYGPDKRMNYEEQTGTEPAINYKAKVPTYVIGDDFVSAARGKGHEKDEVIVDEGDVYESDKLVTTHQFSDNQEQQTDTLTDFQNSLTTKLNEETDSKMSQVSKPTINYKVNVPTYIIGDELATAARGKGHEREEVIVDEGDVYESDKRVTTHQFSDNREAKLNKETDSKMSQVSEPTINYKANVPTYIIGDELGNGHEREELIVDEGDVYKSDKRVTTHQFSDNQEEQADTLTDEETDSKMSQVSEPTINYKVNVPTYIIGDERGNGHEREELIADEGDVYESDKLVTTQQFSDNQEEQTDTLTDFQNLLRTKSNETDSKISQVSEPTINYKVNVPTYIMADELATAARGKGHEKEELIVDEGDVSESDKLVTTHHFSDNQEEQTDTLTDFENTFTTKETENLENSGILKAGITKEKQEASYITALHTPNISDTYKSTLLETTTFQTAVTPVDIMNKITVTSIPTERSDTPQRRYFTIQDGDGSTDTLDKSLVQKKDPPYIHTDEYDTSPSSYPTTTPQDKYYNVEERSSSDSGDNAVDVWNQHDAEQSNHSDDTNIYQEHVFTSDISVDNKEGLDPLYFIVPTIAPQQNGVTSNYIQLYETQMGESAHPLPETQNKQNNLISSEQSMNEYILPLETTDHTDIPVLQHFTLGLQKSESLPTRNISLQNIVDMTKSLQNTVNSTNIMNEPHQDQDLIQDHNTIQLSDFIQPSLYTRNSLTQMQSDDDINSDINETDYTNVQTDITTEHPLIKYNDLSQRLYKGTPEAAVFNGMKSSAGNTHMGHNMDQQRHTSDGYTPQAEPYEDLSATKHDYFDSYNIHLPKETKESKNMDLQKLESSISDINKENETEHISQVTNLYPNFEGHDINFANEDDNGEQDEKFETDDVPYGNEKLPPNHNIHNTDSSTLQIQNQHKNAERFHSSLEQRAESIDSSLKQTVEPKQTHKDRNEVFESVTQYTSPDSLTEKQRDKNEHECYMYCNNVLNSRPNDRDYMTNEGTRKLTSFPPDDISGLLKEYIQSRNGIASSMELVQPHDLGDILKPEYVSRIVTENEKPEDETEAGKEHKLDAMRAMAESRQAEGDRSGYKQMEEKSEDVTDYQGPEEVAMQNYEWLHDPRTVRRDQKEHKNELQGEYTAEDQKGLQSGIVREQAMVLHGASKRTTNKQNFHTTNAIRQSGEDTRNIMNTLMFLLQNKEKIQSLLDLPYSYAMTSTPSTTIRREDWSQLNKEPIIDQGQVEATNLALNKIKLANVDYSSVETTGPPNRVIMDYIKSNGLSQIESLRERNRQGKPFEDMHTTKSDGSKTAGIFNDEYNLRYHETMQQPSPAYMGPSVNVDRSEVLYKRNKQPTHKLELKPRIRDSNDKWGTAMNLAHLPSQDSVTTVRPNCGPWALYKNYLCTRAASPGPDHHLLHSDDESINTVPTYSYEPGYGFVTGSSLESDKMRRDLFQNLQGKHHSRNYNVQRSDTLSEKEMVLDKNIIDYDEENQSLSDDSMIDTYNAFDFPQLFKFYMYNDDRSSQPKSYNKRKSNSNHNTLYIPGESYQKLIKNSVVSRRPASMGNWNNYKRSPEEIIHPKPSALEEKNYQTHRQHSSDENSNEENIRSFILGLKKEEINKRYDDNGEIWYYKSGKEEYEQPPEWEYLNTDDRQSSSFREAYDQSKEHSHHQDCSEETIIQASPQISLKNANKLSEGNIIRMPVNDPSYNTEVFNMYLNNYKKKLPSEKMQMISKNIYKYSHDYEYPMKHQKLPVKDDGWQHNDVHRTVTQHLLDQKNNHILHQPEDNDNSWGDGYETNESDDSSVIRRTRNAMQYTTIGSSEERERDLYPQYQSRSCQSYNCEGVLASEVKIVTAVLKWLRNIVTDTKRI